MRRQTKSFRFSRNGTKKKRRGSWRGRKGREERWKIRRTKRRNSSGLTMRSSTFRTNTWRGKRREEERKRRRRNDFIVFVFKFSVTFICNFHDQGDLLKLLADNIFFRTVDAEFDEILRPFYVSRNINIYREGIRNCQSGQDK